MGSLLGLFGVLLQSPNMFSRTQSDSGGHYDQIGEVAQILAAGLMRLLARKSSSKSAHFGESFLDISAVKSGHPTPKVREN